MSLFLIIILVNKRILWLMELMLFRQCCIAPAVVRMTMLICKFCTIILYSNYSYELKIKASQPLYVFDPAAALKM